MGLGGFEALADPDDSAYSLVRKKSEFRKSNLLLVGILADIIDVLISGEMSMWLSLEC